MNEITTDERNFLNHWSMFGVANVVTKVGSHHWALAYDQSPLVFRTKREAMMVADKRALAIGHKKAGII